MSLSAESPAAKTHSVPAAWRRMPHVHPSKAARPPVAAPAAARDARASTLGRAEKLFRRFEQQLADGDHPFSQLRQEFAEWCKEGDVTPPSANQLAALLRQAGLSSSRRGRAKVTVYSKHAARLAA